MTTDDAILRLRQKAFAANSITDQEFFNWTADYITEARRQLESSKTVYLIMGTYNEIEHDETRAKERLAFLKEKHPDTHQEIFTALIKPKTVQ